MAEKGSNPETEPTNTPHSSDVAAGSAPGGTPQLFSDEEVLAMERAAIAVRRNVAYTGRREGPFTPENIQDDLVGLALSGGGIRSAVFNLGLLQTLFRRKYLRHVDFLSTVSGGGYIGSYLSLEASKTLPKGTRSFFDKYPPNARNHPLDESYSSGRQTRRTRRFCYKGKYLLDIHSFSNRYLIGLFFTLMFAVSGLIATGSLLALLWRCFDFDIVRDALGLLDLRSDLYAPFWPFLAFGVLWVFVWSISYLKGRPGREPSDIAAWRRWRRRRDRHLNTLFLLMIGSGLIGLAILIGNGDISLGTLGYLIGQQDATVSHSVYLTLLTLLGLGLLPLIRPSRVLQSGGQPTRPWQTWVFRITMFCLLAGIPLMTIGLIGKENISGFAHDRRPDLLVNDIKDWTAFQSWLADEDELWKSFIQSDPIDANVRALDGHLQNLNKSDHDLRSWPLMNIDGERGWTWWGIPQRFLIRPAKILESLWRENAITTYWNSRSQALTLEQEIIDELNKALIPKRDFYQFIFKHDTLRSKLESRLAGAPTKDILSLPVLWRQALQGGTDAWDSGVLKRFNRQLLETLYPQHFNESSAILRVLLIHPDQWTRLWIFGIALAIFVVSILLVDVNYTSVHRFYRRRLADAYLNAGGKDKPLSQLDNTYNGAPYHLMLATLNLLGQRLYPHRSKHAPFVFSPLYCGSTCTGYEPTSRYMNGHLDLATAMSVSGAAFGPTSVNSLPLLYFLGVLNIRLGQWFPRPGLRKSTLRITPWTLLRDFVTKPAEHWRYRFLSDGGHHENLGLEQLLLRRCALMIVSDASQDKEYEFADLANAIRRVRVEHGIRVVNFDDDNPLKIGPLKPDKAGRSRRHFVLARVQYPEPSTPDGILIYLKPSFTGDEDIDLNQFRVDDSDFPHDSTANQFYDDRKVESYRQLGQHIGAAVCDALDQFDHARTVQKIDEEELDREPLTRLIETLRDESQRLRRARAVRPHRQAEVAALLRHYGPEANALVTTITGILTDPSPTLRDAFAWTLKELVDICSTDHEPQRTNGRKEHPSPH